MSDTSKNELAGKIMGFRNTIGFPLDQPSELGFHCPCCKYENIVNGNYDERLNWSEYRGFIWCKICNKDYPSALCQPDIDKAIEIFLLTVNEAKQK